MRCISFACDLTARVIPREPESKKCTAHAEAPRGAYGSGTFNGYPKKFALAKICDEPKNFCRGSLRHDALRRSFSRP
jgi:hypothetical protein